MSTTQISQTLFRFTSIRNPALSDPIGIVKRFVYRAPALEELGPLNVFDLAVSQNPHQPRWTVLQNAAAAFRSSASFVADGTRLEAVVGEGLTAFATWLARNSNNFTNTELLARIIENPGGALPVLVFPQVQMPIQATLWNNLFYQIVTQESFYVKEGLMQLLLAIHVLEHAEVMDPVEGPITNRQLANAKVVLPKSIFSDGDATDGDPVAAAPAQNMLVQPGVFMQRNQAVSNARYLNNIYNDIDGRTKRIAQLYATEYQTAYATAYAAYLALHKPLIDSYNAEADTAKQSWCSVRGTTPLSPSDPCGQPPIIRHNDIPPFTFDFAPEKQYLQTRLQDRDIDFLNQLDGYPMVVGPVDEEPAPEDGSGPTEGRPTTTVESFEQVYRLLGTAIGNNNQTIIANTYNQVPRTITIGGVPIPTYRPAHPTRPATVPIQDMPNGEWQVRGFRHGIPST